MSRLECGQDRVNGRGEGRYDVTQGRETVLTRVENSNAGHGNARPGDLPAGWKVEIPRNDVTYVV